MNIPSDLHYTNDHEWIRIRGTKATVGITDFAQGELGDIVFVEIETVGKQLNQGDTFGSIEAVKTVSDLFMPVSGQVLGINDKINDAPDLINNDPYGEGWLIEMEISDEDEVKGLLDAAGYEKLVSA